MYDLGLSETKNGYNICSPEIIIAVLFQDLWWLAVRKQRYPSFRQTPHWISSFWFIISMKQVLITHFSQSTTRDKVGIAQSEKHPCWVPPSPNRSDSSLLPFSRIYLDDRMVRTLSEISQVNQKNHKRSTRFALSRRVAMTMMMPSLGSSESSKLEDFWCYLVCLSYPILYPTLSIYLRTWTFLDIHTLLLLPSSKLT